VRAGAGLLAVLSALLIMADPATAQDSTRQLGPVDTTQPSPLIRPGDDLARIPGVTSSTDNPYDSQKVKEWPNPTTTLLKSMVVPGWGQITNRRYFKAALAIGLETWFLAGTIYNWGKANDALAKFKEDPENNVQYYFDYQFYWGNRSDFIWLLGLTVFVSMFDAYVDAHLRPYEHDTIPGVEPPKGLEVVVYSF
jgi:hypothetical protein